MIEKFSSPLTMPRLVTTCDEVREAVTDARTAGKLIGLVPTMGALHDGHLSLVRASNEECAFTVVTIFVNPTQFGPNEDLRDYPRTLESDLAMLGSYDVDLVFAPDSSELYPNGFSTYVEPPAVAQPLEGRCRPGHFRGVATVVLKLFNLIPADIAFFGQKDYQQSLVIRRMVEDLDLPITIRVCPTVREPDELAMSSRNAYLNDDEHEQALALSQCLALAGELVEQGERNAGRIKTEMQRVLVDAGIAEVDYVDLVDPDSLENVDQIESPTMALVAAYVGETRLIDNRRIG